MTKTPEYARAAAVKSYDAQAHTIELEASTENPVQGLVLSHKRGAIDLSLFTGRAQLLNTHKMNDIRDVLGKVIAARIEDRKLIATVKLTRREDAAGIITDILDGIVTQTSIGYHVLELGPDIVDPKTGARTRVASRWRPYEVSVASHAKDATRVRSETANSGATERTQQWTPNKKTRRKPAPTLSRKRALRFDPSSGKLAARPSRPTS